MIMNIEKASLDSQQQGKKDSYIKNNNLSPRTAHALAFMLHMKCDNDGANVTDPLKYVQSSVSGMMQLRTLLGDNDAEELIFDFYGGK